MERSANSSNQSNQMDLSKLERNISYPIDILFRFLRTKTKVFLVIKCHTDIVSCILFFLMDFINTYFSMSNTVYCIYCYKEGIYSGHLETYFTDEDPINEEQFAWEDVVRVCGMKCFERWAIKEWRKYFRFSTVSSFTKVYLYDGFLYIRICKRPDQ